jgi:Fe2+ transport system protein FeoA
MAKKKSGQRVRAIDKDFGYAHTKSMLQLSGNKKIPAAAFASLMDLRKGDAAILEGIDLPTEDARRLMELGFVPGTRITAGNSAPGGDPRVFQVDGSEIALRRDTARRLTVRIDESVEHVEHAHGANPGTDSQVSGKVRRKLVSVPGPRTSRIP